MAIYNLLHYNTDYKLIKTIKVPVPDNTSGLDFVTNLLKIVNKAIKNCPTCYYIVYENNATKEKIEIEQFLYDYWWMTGNDWNLQNIE